MNNLMSYFGLIDARMSPSDKELPVQTWMSMDGEHKPAFRMLYYWTQINDMVRTALILMYCGLLRIYELKNVEYILTVTYRVFHRGLDYLIFM